MYLHVEHWRARPAWLALSISDRISYLGRMGAAVQAPTRTGVRLLGVSVRTDDRSSRPGEQYVAAWAMPGGAAQGRQLEHILAAAGWHDYFAPGSDRGARSAARSLFDVFPTAGTTEARIALERRRN